MRTAGSRKECPLDRLRVLISQELGEYHNLKCHILANYPDATGRDNWIDLDVLVPFTASALGLWSAGDSVHDPRLISVHVAQSASGPWQPVRSFDVAAGTASRQAFAFGDQRSVTSRYWRLVVERVVPTGLCSAHPYCQPWIGELQLRSSDSGEWRVNRYGANVGQLERKGRHPVDSQCCSDEPIPPVLFTFTH